MCHLSCIKFAQANISAREILNKKIIEIGSLNINGSLRELICEHKPAGYLGVDIVLGPGVDEICSINNLVDRYGEESFDMVICTEVLEHVRNWRSAVTNLKDILKPNGVLILTTRSKGFGFHAFPFDFWRFGKNDLEKIFADLAVETIKEDPDAPGVFLKARKPDAFTEISLVPYKIYSIISRKRSHDINGVYLIWFKIILMLRQNAAKIIPVKIKAMIKKLISAKEKMSL